MTRQQIDSLRMEFDKIVENPSQWLRGANRYGDLHPDYDHLARFARWLVADAEEQEAQHYKIWCDRYGLGQEDVVTKFLYGLCQTTLAEVRENQDGFAGHVVRLGHLAATLDERLRKIEVIFGTQPQEIVQLKQG